MFYLLNIHFLVSENIWTRVMLQCVKTVVYSKLASLFTLYMAVKQKTTYAATATMWSFHQFHYSVQLVTLALGWLRLIGGQYVFALRGRLLEVQQPDAIVSTSVSLPFLKTQVLIFFFSFFGFPFIFI